MPSFEYQAITESGEHRKGFIEADSERLARNILRDDRLLPVELKQVSGRKQNTVPSLFRRSVPSRHVALFSRHLATLVDSGIPVEEALYIVSRQTKNGRLRKVVLSVRSRVREGYSLSEGLEEHPNIFGDVFRAIVQAGEGSGNLGNVLNNLADYLEEGQNFRSSMIQGLIYPLILTLVAIGVVTMLMSFVVPKVIAQFDHAQQTLPTLTVLLIHISEAVEVYGFYLLSVLCLIPVVGHWVMKDNSRKRWLHGAMLNLPVISSVVVSIDTSRFLRTLFILVNSGVTLVESIQVAENTVANLKLQAFVQNAASQVQSGISLHKALAEQNVFPVVALYMIANGEKTGELAKMLDKAAGSGEKELERSFKVFLTLFEPAVIILLGGVVLMIVLAIILPIVQLNDIGTY